MRSLFLHTCFICVCFITQSLSGIAQQGSLLLAPYHAPFEKASVGSFLKDLINRQQINVEYASGNFDSARIVRIPSSNMTVGLLLKQLFRNEKVQIVQRQNKIIITPSESVLSGDFFPSQYSLFGFIKNAENGEPLPFSVVYETNSKKYTEADEHGYFTLSLPEGKRNLIASYVGFENKLTGIDLQSNQEMVFSLIQKEQPEDVRVSTELPSPGVKVNFKDGKELFDNVLGEQDAMRSFYLLPGVQNIPDITNGLLVRGGGPDQNLFYLDGTTIFNPSHLLGMISIINKTALKSISFYKSDFPARYGGSVSSVTNVLTKDGNMKHWQGKANIGFLAASVTVEGPLVKDKTAVMMSVRKSWVNPFLKLMRSSIGVDFYDAQLKITQQLNKNDKLIFMGYAGNDKMNLFFDTYNNKQNWGNQAASLTWNKIIGPKTFAETKISTSRYKNIAGFNYNLYDSTGVNQVSKVYNTFSSLSEWSAGTNIKHAFNNDFIVQAGGQFSSTLSKPFNSSVLNDFADNETDFTSPQKYPYRLWTVYAEMDTKLDSLVFLRAGLHVSNFINGNFTSTSFEPRLLLTYRFAVNQQLQLSVNRMTQYQHRVTNPYLGVNNDIWLPAGPFIRPEYSNMFNVGYRYKNKQKLVLNADVYYQFLNNVTNYAEGKNLFLNNSNWERSVETGKGFAYGLELQAEQTFTKWLVRVAYALAKNDRKFEKINNGNRFPYKYDRRHYLNIAVNYMPSKPFSFSGLWTFATGDMYSVPQLLYPDFDNAQQVFDPYSPQQYRLVYQSSGVNQFRAMPYHRLDVSGAWQHKLFSKLPSVLTAGIYNIYGAPSQYVYDIEGTLGKRSLVVASKYQFFKITPYLSYSIAF